MQKIMTFETLPYFAETTADVVKTPVRGIVLNFAGLGFAHMFSEHDDYTMMLDEPADGRLCR